MNETSFWTDLPLWPARAATSAGKVDALFLFLVAITLFFSLLIATLVVWFGIRYRSRGGTRKAVPVHGSLALELIWTLIPLALAMVIFGWGAHVYMSLKRPPDEAMDVHVVGKQWMWKLQHPGGRREINELHVPVGRPVRLLMTSEDVIHSFFVPAFRIKMDVYPGRYTETWFEATKPGRYHLFCTEYCGTKHSEMIGWVEVMEPADFQAWLSGDAGISMASAGERLFTNLGCITCHHEDPGARGPSLHNLFGSEVHLEGGTVLTADESYIRQSILDPSSQLVKDYKPIMPTFRGLVSEEGVLQLMEYIKTLTDEETEDTARSARQETEEPAS
ncbi:MAG: cytochrome c oxidase subunit II [Acidobacteriota bacterium]|jgi:cytochrome c oxidase subunit 2